MNADKILSVVKFLLSFGGSYLLGANLFGQAINESILQEITGIIMGLVALGISISQKKASLEMVQGGIRQAFTFIGGLLVASGKISAETFTLGTGVVVAIGSYIYGQLSKRKSQKIAEGTLAVEKLRK